MDRYVVRKMAMPYFKPWAVVDSKVGCVVSHANSEAQAKSRADHLNKTNAEALPSPIQPTKNPYQAAETRMTVVDGGDPSVLKPPGAETHRRIEL